MRATAVSQRLWALLALFLFLNFVLAGVPRPLPRQEEDSSITEASSASSTPAASTTVGDDASGTASVSVASSTGTNTATASVTTGSSTGSATSTIISATPFVPSNGTQQNSTESGQLPLTPTRTPGFYVAAFVLMISGAVYIIFGMQRQWVHCFFSFALLVAIAITALELLLVSTPISDGAQGGFIVAVIVGGAVAGGLATLRPKFFHFFGSVLGGFCFAMWLLTLRESALLGQETLKNSIFLAAFSLVSLGFYCNTRTRHYLVMLSSSMAGATAFILGVDCVSCAGLKEFWAWIWNLPNDDLFPIDADNYPLTTGMKAELGVTVVVFLLGVVFQWAQLKTIKENRIKEENELNEERAAVLRTDEKAGMEFERRIAAERRQFEANYRGPQTAVYEGRGSRMDKFLAPINQLLKSIDDRRSKRKRPCQEEDAGAPRDVVVNDEDNMKGIDSRQTSAWDSAHGDPKDQIRASVHTADESGIGDVDTERKHRISGSTTTATRVSTAVDQQDIELDEIRPVASPQSRTAAEAVMAKDDNGGRVTVHVAMDEVHADAAAWSAHNPVPDVVPLPFKVPTVEGEEEEPHADDEDCSSVAVMTEGFHDNDLLETRSIGSKRSSFAKRLSAGSAELFRRLSHHSLSKHLEKSAMGGGDSTEDLAAAHDGNRSSIAATCDEVSSTGEDGFSVPGSPTGHRPFSMEIKAELADSPTDKTDGNLGQITESSPKNVPDHQPASTAATAPGATGTGAEEDPVKEDDSNQASTKEEKEKQVAKVSNDDEESANPSKTSISDATSRPLTLATGKLDKRVSEVVKQYRMVEWAKHQTLAEEPILDNLDIPEPGGPSEPVPVNVEDLLKTAETGAIPVAKPRTEAMLKAMARKTSAQSQSPLSPNPENYTISNERQAAIQATAAALAGGAIHRASNNPYEIHDTVPAADHLRSRPPVPGVKSFNAPQSLVAKRETMLRMKQQALRPDSLRSSSLPMPGPGSGSAHGHAEGHGSVAALGPPSLISDPNSTPSSRRNSGTYRAAHMSSALPNGTDDDDMPLSQRRAIIRERRSSMNSANSSGDHTGSDGMSHRSLSGYSPQGHGSATSLAGNQNLPHTQRRSTNPSQIRESQLANFRSSVQADLRASKGGLPVTTMFQQPGYGGGYSFNSVAPVNGPLINSVYTIPGTSSANSLLPQQTQPWNAEMSTSLDIQRQYMMAKKENDARRREQRRAERERQSLIRQSSMGTPQLMDAHSAALMNLQKKARDAL